jgi:DNA-binding NarL/FixJ family response regulator
MIVSPGRLRVMIVDDDRLVRAGLRLLFRAMPEITVVTEASDGSDVLRQLSQIPVDVILSDVRMRTMHGTAMIPSVRDRYPDVRIVLMSCTVGVDFAEHARNAGADAFVPKTAPAEQIRDAVVGSIVTGLGRPRRLLTVRESAVASFVASGSSNAQISDALNLSPNTVKTYVSRVMAKLEVENRVQLANLLNDR